MRTPKRPFDGEPSDDGAPSYEWLDEWLCEYVDGTMDPSVEAVFEQYVEADPELKAHVERLRKTREILCGGDAPESDCPSCSDLPIEVGRDRDEESLRGPPGLTAPSGERSGKPVGIAVSIVVALIVGFLAGSVLVDPSVLSRPPLAETVDPENSAPEAVRTEAPPRPGRSTPAFQSQVSSVSGDDVLFPSSPMSSPTASDSAGASSEFTTVEDR